MSSSRIVKVVLVLIALFYCSSAVEDEILCEPSSNILLGTIGTFDKYIGERKVVQKSMVGATFGRTLIFDYEEDYTISYILGFENGESQNATIFVVEGGIGYTNATIKMEGKPDRGFDYTIVIWGKSIK